MKLSLDNPFNNGYGKGIFISLVTIADVEDISNSTLPYMQYPVDIGLNIHLNIGKAFNPQMTIAGNFNRDSGSDEVIGWGSAFVVQDFLSKLGFKGSLTPQNTFPASIFELLIGKQFYRLSYISGVRPDGKFRYSDWNIIATAEEGAQALADKFYKSLLKGYPKNYRPQLLDENKPEPSFSDNGKDEDVL